MDCPQCGMPAPGDLVICRGCGALLSVHNEEGPADARMPSRSLAWMIDNLVGLLLWLVAAAVIIRPLFIRYYFPDGLPDLAGGEIGVDVVSMWNSMGAQGRWFAVWLMLLNSFVPSAVYFTALESSPWQASLGKRVAGVQVADLEGRRISPWRAFVRFAGRWVSLTFWPLAVVSVATILTTKERQALHDKLSGCRVRRKT